MYLRVELYVLLEFIAIEFPKQKPPSPVQADLAESHHRLRALKLAVSAEDDSANEMASLTWKGLLTLGWAF